MPVSYKVAPMLANGTTLTQIETRAASLGGDLAAAMGPRVTCQGAGGARTVKATAATGAVGPGGRGGG